MFGWFREWRSSRLSRRQYELRMLELLMADNRRRIAELGALSECPWCMAMESPEQRTRCDFQFGAAK